MGIRLAHSAGLLAVEEAGGQVIQKLWVPLGTTDLAPCRGC